jgi:hypothetical protein
MMSQLIIPFKNRDLGNDIKKKSLNLKINGIWACFLKEMALLII